MFDRNITLEDCIEEIEKIKKNLNLVHDDIEKLKINKLDRLDSENVEAELKILSYKVEDITNKINNHDSQFDKIYNMIEQIKNDQTNFNLVMAKFMERLDTNMINVKSSVDDLKETTSNLTDKYMNIVKPEDVEQLIKIKVYEENRKFSLGSSIINRIYKNRVLSKMLDYSILITFLISVVLLIIATIAIVQNPNNLFEALPWK